jgi:hypothetical protein
MFQWIIIGFLYLAGFGLLALLGGLAAAGEGLRRWGERSSCVTSC